MTGRIESQASVSVGGSTADCDEGIPGPGAFGVVDGLLKALIGRLDMTAVEDVGLNAVSGHLVGHPLRGCRSP